MSRTKKCPNCKKTTFTQQFGKPTKTGDKKSPAALPTWWQCTSCGHGSKGG